MRSFSIASLLAIPLGAFGLQITSPVQGVVWNNTGPHTVTWVSIPSDPSAFAMYLINSQTSPPETVLIAADVPTSDETYTFVSAVPVGNTTQIQFNSIADRTEVLAQSPDFSIVIGGPQGFSATGSATAVVPVTTSPALTTSATTPTGGSTSTSPGTGKSSGDATYGSRGLAVAMAIIGVGLTAMFVV